MSSESSTLDHALQQFGPMLARIVASYEADPAWREDLLQEISLALWKALPAFRGEAGMRTFVARIAHNRAVNHLVKQKRVRERGPFDEDTTATPQPGSKHGLHERLDLAAAMRRLPIDYRQPLSLMLEGFRQSEIGEILGLTENTVAQRLGRGRRKLKQLLNPETQHDR